MARKAPDLEAIYQSCQAFPKEFETLLMATCSGSGQPEASYAAYLEESGDYYVYLSELALHTSNLQENPQCSVLFIENEKDARHLFARHRLTYQCEAAEVERGSDHFEEIMGLFKAKFGNFMEMLHKLEDFHLFRLKPKKGNYITGFAQAFEVTGDKLNQVRLRDDQGHRGDIREPKIKKAVGG